MQNSDIYRSVYTYSFLATSVVTSTVAAPVMAGGPRMGQTLVVNVNVGGPSSRQQVTAGTQENTTTPSAQPEGADRNTENQGTAMNNTVAAQDSTLGLSETMDLSQEPGLNFGFRFLARVTNININTIPLSTQRTKQTNT